MISKHTSPALNSIPTAERAYRQQKVALQATENFCCWQNDLYLFTDDGFNAAEDDFLLLVIAFGFVYRNAQVLVLLMGKQSLCAAEHHGNAAVGEGVVGFRFTSARLHSHIPF